MALNVVRRMDILIPTAERKWGDFRLSPRLETIEGKVVGLLNNHKEAAKPLLNSMGEFIQARYHPARLLHLDQTAQGGRWGTGPAPMAVGQEEEEVLEFFSQCHAVIAAVGD